MARMGWQKRVQGGGEELRLHSFICSFTHLVPCPPEKPRLCLWSSWGHQQVKGQLQSHRISEKRKSSPGAPVSSTPSLGRTRQGGEEGWELPRRGRRLGQTTPRPLQRRRWGEQGEGSLAEVFICRAGGGQSPSLSQEISQTGG